VPASALERLVLPSRVPGYGPQLLDELTTSGEVVWAGAGALPGKDGWVALYPADSAPLLLPPAHPLELTPVHQAVLSALEGGYGLFFRQIADRVHQEWPDTPEPALAEAVWELAWSGRLTNDSLAPLRSLLGSGRTAGSTAHRARRSTPRGRYGSLAVAAGPGRRPPASRGGPPTVAGRWSLLPPRESDPTVRAHALARTLLDRHGVVTRGAVSAEGVTGGFAAAYRVLSVFEESGQARRGYVVEGLGAAQFAMEGAVDRLRAIATSGEHPGPGTAGKAVVLAAADPANAYGAALPWPEPPQDAGHKPGRKAGALVVLVDGALVCYLERGGRSLLAWRDADDTEALRAAAGALAAAAGHGALGTITVERVNGTAVLSDPTWVRLLEEAGFHATPRGLRLRG
jgi:ATP-dependent Lhr-like helicase